MRASDPTWRELRSIGVIRLLAGVSPLDGYYSQARTVRAFP
ncbi:MAG: hypothetical protein WBH16_10515 [Candidatus Nanopelagicales bacterium]